MNVMLLAAGEGTRLRPYTSIQPKPAIPFLNVPLAAHALHFLSDLSINKLVVNTFHLPEKIHELFHSLPKVSEQIHFSDERSEILGSGGGLSKARSHFLSGDDFIMMNADEVILPQEEKIMSRAFQLHKDRKVLASLMVTEHPGVGTQFGGVWTDAHNKVIGFGKTPTTGSVKGWHFVGVQILSPTVFEYLPAEGVSNILYDALANAIKDGHTVQAIPFKCLWFETGNPKDFLEASEVCLHLLAKNENTQACEHLKTCIEKYSQEKFQLHVSDSAMILQSSSARLSSEVQISGFACLGPQSSLSGKITIKNTVINRGHQVVTSQSDTLVL